MTAHNPADRIDLTILELARKLVQLELQRTALTRVDFITASDVRQRIKGRAHPPSLDDCMGSVLDYLVTRGLVVAMRDECEVTSYRPQRYRWSKHATSEALERFAAPAKVIGAHTISPSRGERGRSNQTTAGGTPFSTVQTTAGGQVDHSGWSE